MGGYCYDEGWTVLVWLMAHCTGVAHDRGQWRTVLVWLIIGVSSGL